MTSTARGFVLAFGLALMSAAPGWAHAALQKAEPTNGAVLTRMPKQVSLWFGEEVQPGLSRIVVKLNGHSETAGQATVDPKNPKHLTVPVTGTAKGPYRVQWRALARDGHPSSGAYTFLVK